MEIGKRIKEAREHKGFKSKEFADILKIDASQYSKIENGKLLPTLLQIIEIGKHLDISLDWLILGKQVQIITPEENLKESYELALQNIKLQEEIIKLKDRILEIDKSRSGDQHKSKEEINTHLRVAESESELIKSTRKK